MSVQDEQATTMCPRCECVIWLGMHAHRIVRSEAIHETCMETGEFDDDGEESYSDNHDGVNTI